MFPLLAIGLIGAFFAFHKGKGVDPATVQARAEAIAALQILLARMGSKQAAAQDIQKAIALCTSLALVKTAQALRNNAGLPNDEAWPDTRVSVADFVKKLFESTKKA